MIFRDLGGLLITHQTAVWQAREVVTGKNIKKATKGRGGDCFLTREVRKTANKMQLLRAKNLEIHNHSFTAGL